MDYKVGDTVVYASADGQRSILVDDKDPDIKNGRPGFGGTVVRGPLKGMSVWGYDEQIVEVVSNGA